MRLQSHLAASAAVGGGVWAATGDPVTMPVAIAAGVLPDADHILDYYFKYVRRDRRFHFFLLHAWEYLITGILVYLFVTDAPWMLALVAGYASQLVLDQVSHFKGAGWTGYFITPRALRGFRAPWYMVRPNPTEYQSLVKSLPFFGDRVERWLRSRIEPPRR